MDWSGISLGHPREWPKQLTILVDFMLESSQPMFLLWGEDRTFLFNEAFRPVLGEEYHKAIGTPLHLLWTEIWSDISPFVDDAFAGRSRLTEDKPFRTWSSGYQETRYYTFSYSPVRDPDGKVVAAMCIASDTTEKVLAQDNLERERDELHNLFEQAPVFLALGSTADMRFEYANRAYRDLVGCGDIAGKTVNEAMPEAEEQGFTELLRQVARTGEAFEGRETPFVRITDGKAEERFLDFIYQPICAEDGAVTGILCVGSDVTEQHQSREQARKLQEQVHQTGRLGAMGAMAATLAHELNQPLAAASNYLRGTRRLIDNMGEATPAGVAVGLTETEKQILRAGEIIRRVRDMVAGTTRSDIVSVRDLIHGALKQADLSTLCPDVTVKMQLHEESALVQLDILQAEQVLVNLIRNACQAMEGCDRRELTISTTLADIGVQLCVSDTGIGLHAGLEEVLFSPFAGTSGGEGMGIGLSICRTIVEANGGRIWASNNESGGASFCFTVPRPGMN